jgi:predicted transglutaminase-like cysteine proteinase
LTLIRNAFWTILLGILVSLIIYHSGIAATDFSKLSSLANQRYGERARASILELQATVNELKSASEIDKLKGINDFFNRKIKYFDEDINIWGVPDYWATPLESLGKERGDCEDFSIAKYIFLKELNIPDDRLKLTYVRAQIGGPYSKIFQAHMVVTYYASPSAEPLILDNLIPDIRQASRRKDLTPVFSFNSEGLWIGATTATSKGDPSTHLSRWRDVLSRIQADGIE